MPFRDMGCIFNEETKERIYELYTVSNLEVLEYVNKILTNDETITEALKDYLSKNSDEQDEELDIFWKVMDYLEMSDYIAKREKERY